MSYRAATSLDHPAARWWFVDTVWLTIRPNEPHSWHRPSRPSARRMSHPILADLTISSKEPSSFFEGEPPGANDVGFWSPHCWPPGKTMSYRSPPWLTSPRHTKTRRGHLGRTGRNGWSSSCQTSRPPPPFPSSSRPANPWPPGFSEAAPPSPSPGELCRLTTRPRGVTRHS
jgi:hypothetical protein